MAIVMVFPFFIVILSLLCHSMATLPHLRHYEARSVSCNNLSFGVSSFSFVWSFGTRDCFVRAKGAPPRNDNPHPLSLRAPRSGAKQSTRANSRVPLCCHCEGLVFQPRSNLAFWLPIHLRYQRLPRQGKIRPSSQ